VWGFTGHTAPECADSGGAPALVTSNAEGFPPRFRRRTDSMRTRHDPTNLDHVAFIGVGIGIVGWILKLLLA